MTRAAVNGLELEYDTVGDPADPAAILIAGLGAQLITWHPEFCQELVDRRFFVIRFDNRDVGLSSKIEQGDYALEDMADDTVGLLDALGIDAAHVIGASMGGMIAQTVAIRHPRRVRTLTSIMSTTGDSTVGGASPEAAGRLLKPAGETREERIASSIESMRVNWGDTPQFPFDAELARWRAELSIDRSYYPVGTMRQMMAIRASGDRTAALRQLDVPTLVIHGSNDPLVGPSGGEATAAAIKGAEHLVIEGMGHAVSRPAWGEILDAIAKLAARAAS
jgi:pimeloyl-ACP methyl ester carboxylesterase